MPSTGECRGGLRGGGIGCHYRDNPFPTGPKVGPLKPIFFLTRRQSLGAAFFFLLISILFTYPLFFLGPHRIYGLQEDITRYLHLFWCIQQNEDWFFQHRHYPQLNAPWGWDVQNTAQRFYWWLGAAYSDWVSPWTFNNWVIALSFPLSGYFFFRLAFELTGSFWG